MNWDTATPPPADLHGWLYEQGSLTERLGRTFGTPVHVRVLAQKGAPALPHEADATDEKTGWVREVILYHQPERPLLWARSFVPRMTPDNPWKILQTLGEKPLGALIFTLDDLFRGDFQVGRAHDPAKMGETPVWHGHWGRWHLLRWQDAPLVLTEVLLFDE